MAQFRQDRLTERQRFEALLNRKPIDRVPFDPFARSFAAVNVGYPIAAMYEDPKRCFEAISRTHEMFDGWHFFFFQSGAFGAREFGGEVSMPTSQYAMAVSLLRPAVTSEEDARKLRLPDIESAGGIPLMIQSGKLQEKQDFAHHVLFGGYINATRICNRG